MRLWLELMDFTMRWLGGENASSAATERAAIWRLLLSDAAREALLAARTFGHNNLYALNTGSKYIYGLTDEHRGLRKRKHF
jgi:hypothetical protein